MSLESNATMPDSFFSIRDIRKTYGPVTAVESVTLDIAKGELLTFLGDAVRIDGRTRWGQEVSVRATPPPCPRFSGCSLAVGVGDLAGQVVEAGVVHVV